MRIQLLHRLVCMSMFVGPTKIIILFDAHSGTFFPLVSGRKTLLPAAARDDDQVSEKARAVNRREVRWPTRVACR